MKKFAEDEDVTKKFIDAAIAIREFHRGSGEYVCVHTQADSKGDQGHSSNTILNTLLSYSSSQKILLSLKKQ